MADKRATATTPSSRTYSTIGHSPAGLDAIDKVRGTAVYIEDIKPAGMLYGKVCRSRVPHARIVRIDTSKAEALPGVMAVVTGAEIPFNHGESLVDEPFLARDKVRYLGEAVAVVAAMDETTAQRAAALIEVEYETLPATFDAVEASQPGAPLVHEDLGAYKHAAGVTPVPATNVCNRFELRKGDVDAAFTTCDRVFEDVFSTPMQHHCTLEPHGAICLMTADGRITLWTNNDSPYRARRELSEAFGVSMADIRVITPPNIGGNFGSKGGLKAEAAATAIAWKLRGRPIRVLYSREEEFASAIGRHPSRTRIKTGVMNDGTIVAREVETYLDSGAYAEKGPTVARFCGLSAIGPYNIPNVRVDVYCVYTNKTMAGAMRGYGGPQAAWAYESQMDIIARELGLDPVEFRMRHLYGDGDEHAAGQRLTSVGLKDCVQKVAESMDWGRPRPAGRGIGIACMERAVKTPFASAAFIKVNEDGSVDILSSTTEVGQGIDTALRQVAAEELGVSVDVVRRAAPDTSFTPFDASTTSSRSMFHMGNAVRIAAHDAKSQLLQIAAPRLGVPVEHLDIRDGRIAPMEASTPSLSIKDLLKQAYGPTGTVLGRGFFWPEVEEGDAEYYSRHMAFWLQGAAGAEVEVDPDTGEVRLVKLWGAYDVGKAINRVTCEGQIHGGASMGAGFALGEEVTFKNGVVLNPSFLGYRVPYSLDLPEQEAILVENPNPQGPFGAKGMAETTNVAVAPAIANAVADAIGVRVRHLPITPDKIVEALRRQRRGRSPDEPLAVLQSRATDTAEGI